MAQDETTRERLRGRGVYPHEHADHLLNPLRNLIMPPWLLVRRLRLRPADRVLEIGPGPGYFSPAVARKLTRGQLVLYDLQPEMLERAAARVRAAGLDNFEARQGSADALPFHDDEFDVVFLVAVLGEVPDPSAPPEEQAHALARVMSEAKRVLKPGGILSITEVPGDPDFVPEDRVRALARDAGFEPERRRGFRWFYTLNLRAPR